MNRHHAANSEHVPPFSPTLLRWFAWYLQGYFARNFTAVRISKAGLPPTHLDANIIFYSNHPSWWDPILYMLLGHRFFPDREGYGPMDAAALEKYAFFKRLGVFGVEPGTRRGAGVFLRTARAVLRRPRANLWMTAEGEFTDPRKRPVLLRPGLAHLAKHVRGAVAVPLAMEYPFWGERLPETLVRFGDPIVLDHHAGIETEEWNRLFACRLEETLDALAEEAQSRDPALFHTLVTGRRGIGGVYDHWRRLKAAIQGAPFRPAHGEEGS